jgi:hypothetical protein
MWFAKVTLMTLWMAGNIFGLTMGGLVHVLGLLAVALVFLEDTAIERKIRHALFAR